MPIPRFNLTGGAAGSNSGRVRRGAKHGLWSHTTGWNVGIDVTAFRNDKDGHDLDAFTVGITGGRNKSVGRVVLRVFEERKPDGGRKLIVLVNPEAIQTAIEDFQR
jgi:hypothetical protein